MVTLVNEILNTTQTGQLLIVSLEELVRDLGVAEPLHRVPYRTYVPCTKNSWITTLWRFVNYHSISIDGLIEIPPLLRNNDTYLVSRFVQCGYSGKDLKVLNQIRQTLHAFTISDLATADGKQISVDAWQAEGSQQAPGLRSMATKNSYISCISSAVAGCSSEMLPQSVLTSNIPYPCESTWTLDTSVNSPLLEMVVF